VEKVKTLEGSPVSDGDGESHGGGYTFRFCAFIRY